MIAPDANRVRLMEKFRHAISLMILFVIDFEGLSIRSKGPLM